MFQDRIFLELIQRRTKACASFNSKIPVWVGIAMYSTTHDGMN